jgi:hypothetical protein
MHSSIVVIVEDDFETDNDLCTAYFMLEQQMTIINGNSETIIIPSNWLKQLTNKFDIQSETSLTKRTTELCKLDRLFVIVVLLLSCCYCDSI